MRLSPEDQRRRELAAIKSTLGPGLISKLVLMPIELLIPYDRNARTHSDKQIDQIARSYQSFCAINPLLIDDHNRVVAGHGRLAAAKRLGLTHLPTLQVEGLSSDQLAAYRLADNRLAELAGWDEEILAIEFQHLSSVDLDFTIEAMGWDMPQIDILLDKHVRDQGGDVEDAGEADRADQLPSLGLRAVSRLGDLWQLGRHRVLCGSALDGTTYERLMLGQLARLCCQDPPWNIAVSTISGSGAIKHRPFVMANGEMSEEQFRQFLREQIRLNALWAVPGAVIAIFIDWRGVEKVITAGAAEGLELVNICVWAKTNGGMGSPWRSAHELAVMLKKPGAPICDRVSLGRYGRNRTNVWTMAGQNSFGAERMEALQSHPTRKPVQLIAEAIRDVTDIGDIVLDSFLGSGTCVLAAERTDRICYGMELDPIYVDSIVRRWEAFTGNAAILDGDGSSFAEIDAERNDQLVVIQKPVRTRIRPAVISQGGQHG